VTAEALCPVLDFSVQERYEASPAQGHKDD